MEKHGWQSVRTILEGLILGALIWCGTQLIQTGKQIAVMTNQLEGMTRQLSGVPELGTRVAKLELQTEQNRQDIQELRRLRDLK